MHSLIRLFVSFVILMTFAFNVFAHHSRANFDLENRKEYQGTVTEFSWRNPHTFAMIEVEIAPGVRKELLAELNSIQVLSRLEWDSNTVKEGDEVTVFVYPDKDPSKNLYFATHWILPDGSPMTAAGGYDAPEHLAEFFATGRRQEQVATADVPETSEDFSGIWVRARQQNQGGGNIATGPEIALQTQWGPAAGLPLTDIGVAEIAAWRVEDNPWYSCVSKTPPSLLNIGIGGHRFSWVGDDLTIRSEINDTERVVYMGMSEHPADTERSHLGHSMGWYEGNALVVDTAYFEAASWGNGSGVSSSEQKHLVERFTLTNEGRGFQYEFTVEDPVYLTVPVSLSSSFNLDNTYPFQDNYGCDPEASSRHLVNL